MKDFDPHAPGLNWIRWHTHPVMCRSGDTGMAHQERVAALCAALWPSDHDLIRAAKVHDMPELILGDPPRSAMRQFPEYRKVFESIAARLMAEWKLPVPKDAEAATRLAIADMLDSILTVLAFAPGQLSLPEWKREIAQTMAMAEADSSRTARLVEHIISRGGLDTTP